MNETPRAVAQVFVCALHGMWRKCGVQQQSRVMSFFLCMGRCGVSRKRKAVASQPQGCDPRSHTHRTVSRPPGALVQRRSRALWPCPSRILWARVVRACHSLLASPGIINPPPVESPTEDSTPTGVTGDVLTEGINPHAATAWVVRLRSRVSRQRIHNPKPLRCTALDLQPATIGVHRSGFTTLNGVWINDPRAFRCTASDPRPLATRAHRLCPPVHGVGSTIQRLVKKRPTTWDRASPWKKETKKLYLQPTCTYPGRRNLHEQHGNEKCSGEPQGIPEQKKTVPRVGALSPFSGRCPFPSLCTFRGGETLLC